MDWNDADLDALEQRITEVYQSAYNELYAETETYFAKFRARDLEMLGKLNAGEITEDYYKQWRLTQMGRGQMMQTMADNCAYKLINARDVADAYIKNDILRVYAYNYNYSAESMIHSLSKTAQAQISWTMTNERAVQNIILNNPDLIPVWPEVEKGLALADAKKTINDAVLKGILTGSHPREMAAQIASESALTSKKHALWAARTANTTALNAGRFAAGKDLQSQGVIVYKTWESLHDHRTRPEHLQAYFDYGSRSKAIPIDEPFIVGGEEMMMPGDQSLGASGWNIYNCRCGCSNFAKGFEPILDTSKW